MNDKPDKELLLDDVLAEGAPSDLREAMLGETLRLARRQRRFRQSRNSAVSLALIGIAAMFVWRSLVWRGEDFQLQTADCKIISTQPLSKEVIVVTKPLANRQIITSTSFVEIVQTENLSRNFRIIDDDELLALAAPRPAVLIRLGPHNERLIIVDRADGPSRNTN